MTGHPYGTPDDRPEDATTAGTDDPVVLLVEDDADVADMYREWLRGDYDLLVAGNGHDALDRIDERVDVVLLDRGLPDMAGLDVLQRIRDRGLACQVVVVSVMEPGVDVLDAGFDDYLTKPTTEADLTAAVERCLTRRTYSERYREFDGLATKLATLEANMDVEDLESSPEYTELRERFAEMADDLGELSVDDEEYWDLYHTKLQVLFEATQAQHPER